MVRKVHLRARSGVLLVPVCVALEVDQRRVHGTPSEELGADADCPSNLRDSVTVGSGPGQAQQ